MYELALCASIGGLSLGLQRAGIRTACYVEYNDYRINVLMSRIRDGWLDNAPIWDNVTTFDGRPWRGRVAIVSAGFPCQPFSLAGKMQREQDKRYIWPHIIRTICEVQPAYVILENVRGLLVPEPERELPAPIATVLGDLAACGYDAEWQSLPSSAFGAPHIRDRVFIVAYPMRDGVQRCLTQPIQRLSTFSWLKDCRSVEDLRGRSSIPEPLVRRIDNGVSRGVDRLKAIGEAVLPDIGEYIGRCILDAN